MDRAIAPRGDRLVVVGGRVLSAGGLVDADVLIEDGRIRAVASEVPRRGRVLDAEGCVVAPGLVDLQINGGFGHDFTSDPASIWAVGALLPSFGVTAFLPTIITAAEGAVDGARSALAAGPPVGYAGAQPLGLHLEGPAISPRRRGTHDRRFLREPRAEWAREWDPDRHVRMVTLAPELPGALPLIAALGAAGVVVAVGHTDASYDQTREAIEAGATAATHVFNAMPPLHHRRPGAVGAVLTASEVTVGTIVDGIHLHPAIVRLVWEMKGPDRFVLVTDAVAVMGSSPGTYRLGGIEVTATEDGPRNPDGGLAGSALTLDEAIRNLVEFTGCSIAEAIAAASTNPARLVGDRHRGTVAIGARGDLVVLDAELRVRATVVGGDVVDADPRSGAGSPPVP